MTTKTKTYKNEIKTDFHDEGLPPEETPCLTYSLVLLDSVYKSDKSYYRQQLLEKCNYFVKIKK